MTKCIYEILDFFYLKMHLWMHGFFNAYIMYVWMNFSFMRKCIYECIYNVCLNESFFYKKSIYECMIFFRFIFIFLIWMHAKKKLECIYKWNFWECIYIVQNARKIHKIFCECIYRCMKIYVFLIFNFF